ncbi:MAG: 30S ribosome-binding factor RbfA [Chlamydiae bacterium]|nr:30S ribosome-binding factor RbfA [Chlamydiota bacterium]
MKPRRIERINSLLKEVLSEVILHDLKHRNVPELITVTNVDTSNDLTSAKVFVSLIEGNAEKKEATISMLQKMASYIALLASKKVTLRYFPALTFKIDDSMDKYMKIDSILRKINPPSEPTTDIVPENE